MDASAVNGDCENGSFQDQPNDTESVSRSRRTASKSAASIWAGLKKRQRARGNSQAGNDKRWNKRPRTIQTTKSAKRTQSAIAEAATEEFEALGEFLSDIPDTRTLALRMYYLELSKNVTSSDAQTKVSKMFSISPSTVKRWATAWEDTGEEALIDHRAIHKGKDKSEHFDSYM